MFATTEQSLQGVFMELIRNMRAEVKNEVLNELQQEYTDRTFNVQEAADYLGVSKQTIYMMCNEKQLKHITVGSLRSKKPVIIFRKSTLDAFLRDKEEESIKKWDYL